MISNGKEEEKGKELKREANELLRAAARLFIFAGRGTLAEQVVRLQRLRPGPVPPRLRAPRKETESVPPPKLDLEFFNGLGGFDTNIDMSFVTPQGIGTDNHPLNNVKGITFQNSPVHIGTGISFIRIANNIFHRPRGIPAGQPFASGRKSAAASPPQTRGFNKFNGFFRGIFHQDFK